MIRKEVIYVTYAYIPRPEQVNVDISVPKGQVIAGNAIGILTFETCYPLLPGNVANASTYSFPVLYKNLQGVSAAEMSVGDPAALEPLIEAAKELQKQGVRAIVGACGYFANYQKDTSARLDIPVFLSALLQVPVIKRGLKPNQKIGAICMNAAGVTPRILSQCGIDEPGDIVVAGAGHLPECQNILKGTGHLNAYKMERELVDLTKQLVNDNPDIGAILFHCSDIATFAWSIQNAVRLPVFDYTTLINWVYSGIVRYPFAGFM